MNIQEHRALFKEVVKAARLMHQKGFVAGLDGNVSARLAEDRVVITPSRAAKGFLEPDDLVVVDMAGRVVEGPGKPSSEFRLHLEFYRLRPDINAVVHGHPVFSVAASLVGLDLTEPVLPEVVLTLGGIPTAPYATPGTEEVPESIRGLIATHDAVILKRHGVAAGGSSPLDAFLKLEKVEHTAKTLFIARLIGSFEPLLKEELGRLKSL